MFEIPTGIFLNFKLPAKAFKDKSLKYKKLEVFFQFVKSKVKGVVCFANVMFSKTFPPPPPNIKGLVGFALKFRFKSTKFNLTFVAGRLIKFIVVLSKVNSVLLALVAPSSPFKVIFQ